MGAHDFELNKVPLFSRKTVNINVSLSAALKLALVSASRYTLPYKLVIPQCLCQVSLGLIEVQMGAHDFKLNKVPLFSLKSVNINVSRSAAPKLALVPANRYDCDICSRHILMSVPSLNRFERGSD